MAQLVTAASWGRAGIRSSATRPSPCLARRLSRPALTACVVPSRVYAFAAVPAAPSAQSSGTAGGTPLLLRVLANPIWVLGGAACWALAQQSAVAWLQQAYLVPALGVLSLAACATVGLLDTTRALGTATSALTRLAVQYAPMPALGCVVARVSGLPLGLTIWLALIGGCLGGVASSWQGKAQPSPLATSPQIAPAVPAVETSPEVPAAAEVACGLDPRAAAARLALAPPTVQAFIQRWGRREGIDAAYSAACTVNWGTVVLESADEEGSHHHESAAEAAFRAQAEDGASSGAAVAPTDAAARLALAPPTVQAFIARWGRRAGIEAAHAHS